MAAVHLLTAVVLNFVQFWQTSGQGKNRIFLVAIKYLFVMSTRFIGCNSTTLAKLIALSTTQNSTKAYSREVPNSPAVEDSQVFFYGFPALWLSNTALMCISCALRPVDVKFRWLVHSISSVEDTEMQLTLIFPPPSLLGSAKTWQMYHAWKKTKKSTPNSCTTTTISDDCIQEIAFYRRIVSYFMCRNEIAIAIAEEWDSHTAVVK